MKKADLLEEIRYELGLTVQDIADEYKRYDAIMAILNEKVSHYKTICLYVTNDTAFNYYKHVGDEKEIFPVTVPFGEGIESIVAARGEISCEFEPGGQTIYIPYYRSHHLLGEMIVKSAQFVDDTEMEFIEYIQELLGKVPK